ncbi:MAG: ATP-dependent 6-phosphofructokinase [Pseudomonadota bacterium]
MKENEYTQGTFDTKIQNLGPAEIDSPILKLDIGRDYTNFGSDDERIVVHQSESYFRRCREENVDPVTFETAGPRRKIFHNPKNLTCAIVTAGGLCPGINDVIRSIVLALYHTYGVRSILGIRYGFQGLVPDYGHDVWDLDPLVVSNIHEMGGTVLASSRGPQDIGKIVDTLERLKVGIIFLIGGDGTLNAASRITDEVTRRNLRISVIGIPKTIDNDICLVSKSFGFDTAVEMAAEAIRSAHTEAVGAPNGIGIVKLMGRHSGFIAANATLAFKEVNFILIPEIDFDIEGEHGFLDMLRKRLVARKHAVVVVAEGAGQKYVVSDPVERDPSGNIKLGDIGKYLVDEIKDYFERIDMPANVRYIDPSYIIRSVPANVNDRIFCGFLGQMAVHAGMAGKTGMLVSIWNNRYVHVPINSAIACRKQIDPNGRLWLSVLEFTGQPLLKNT